MRLAASLSGELDDQSVSSHCQSLSLALLHYPLGLVWRSESHETSSLRLALVVHEDVALADVQLEFLKGRSELTVVDGRAQVADVDRLDLTSWLVALEV